MTIPTGFCQINYRFGSNLSGSWTAEVVFGATLPDPLPGSPTIAADTVCDIWQSEMMPVLSTELQFRGALVKYGPDETGPSGEDVRLVVGSIATAQVPPNVAMLVRKVTTLGGRRGRGRSYLPGLPEGNVDSNGNLTGAYMTTVQAALDSFLVDMATAGFELAVLHDGPSTTGSPEPAPSLITNLQLQTTVATQRRRLRG